MSRSLVPEVVLSHMLAVAANTPAGDFAEIGVYQGGSAFELAKVAREKHANLHLFDTFSGMPFADDDDKHRPGEFADTSIDAVKALIPDAWLYPGIFPHTIPDKLRHFSFVHCDVDQFQSTRDVIKVMWPRLVPGGVMWFDDCELPPALRAIEQAFQPAELLNGPCGRLFAVKP